MAAVRQRLARLYSTGIPQSGPLGVVSSVFLTMLPPIMAIMWARTGSRSARTLSLCVCMRCNDDMLGCLVNPSENSAVRWEMVMRRSRMKSR